MLLSFVVQEVDVPAFGITTQYLRSAGIATTGCAVLGRVCFQKMPLKNTDLD